MPGRIATWLVRGLLGVVAAYVIGAAILRFAVFPPIAGHADMAHAGGAVEGLANTNSIAALEASRALGFRVAEIDLQLTRDGVLVCAHDWNALGGIAPDLDGFLGWRAELRHPPCTADELVDWFERNGDMVLYSDLKSDRVEMQAGMARRLGDRLIVDATTPELVCRLTELGFVNIVFSTYRRPASISRLRTDLAHPCITGNAVRAVALPLERMMAGHGFVARAAAGRPVYAHTVDNCLLAHAMRLLGADALFIEHIGPASCGLGGGA